ncbi:hypothetical protein BG006_002366 [Podila minutissima]|uniref:Uncharacterized protein n=1 Tax=Podila minutissima TaxID=64525 RepID=A0A9P5SD25_9FUNG|nr:hypothetical protein BG006_002366 [Podila minutissima]
MSRIELNDIPVHRWALNVFSPAVISDSQAGRVEFTAKTDKGQFVGVYWMSDGIALYPALLNDIKAGERLLVDGLLSVDVILDAQNAAMQGVDRLRNTNLQRATKKILADVMKSDGGSSSSRSGQGYGTKRPFFGKAIDDDDEEEEEEEEELDCKRMRLESFKRGSMSSGDISHGALEGLSRMFKFGETSDSTGGAVKASDKGRAPAAEAVEGQMPAVAGIPSASPASGGVEGSSSSSLVVETFVAPAPGSSGKSGKSAAGGKKGGKPGTKSSAGSSGNLESMDTT